jgi:hypothetical protein
MKLGRLGVWYGTVTDEWSAMAVAKKFAPTWH